MYKLKKKLQCNKKNFICIKKELLNFKIILPFSKLDIIGARLESNALKVSGDIFLDIQLATFLIIIHC